MQFMGVGSNLITSALTPGVFFSKLYDDSQRNKGQLQISELPLNTAYYDIFTLNV